MRQHHLRFRQWSRNVLLNNMKHTRLQYKRGFTLIETMVAVLLLTVALSALLGLTASSLFAARYARNEITANYLMEEVADYVRNDRDTMSIQDTSATTGSDWTTFLAKYAVCTSANGGCFVEPSNPPASGVYTLQDTCGPSSKFSPGLPKCPVLKYSQGATHNAYYTYQNDVGKIATVYTTFRRQLIVVPFSTPTNATSTPDAADVRINMSWLNGNTTMSRSLNFTVFNWNNN